MTKLNNDVRELTIGELDAVSGGGASNVSRGTIIATDKGSLEFGFVSLPGGGIVPYATWNPK